MDRGVVSFGVSILAVALEEGELLRHPQDRFPEIRVLGSNPMLIRRVLLWAPETQVAALTAGSLLRRAAAAPRVTVLSQARRIV